MRILTGVFPISQLTMRSFPTGLVTIDIVAMVTNSQQVVSTEVRATDNYFIVDSTKIKFAVT